MDAEDRQFLLTTAWMFVRHGQGARAQKLCAAIVADNPRDGIAATVLAERQLDERDAEGALVTLRAAEPPKELQRAAAILETRALAMLGRRAEADRRWRRYLASAKGAERTWVS